MDYTNLKEDSNMTQKELAKLLKDNKDVNRNEEAYVSFISNANAGNWNYNREADYLMGLLTALEKAGAIKIN
jgi:hypothetical protein